MSKAKPKKKTCKLCGLSAPKVKFHSKRSDCIRCRSRAERITAPAEQAPDPVFSDDLPDAEVLVVTWAQNATPVHKKFLASLLTYCGHNSAKLVVIPGRYKNPTSLNAELFEHGDNWWAEELEPYMFNGEATIGRLTIYGDVPIQPTADRPLRGMEVYAGCNSAIFGHPRLQLKTIATAKRRYPRIFTTTGAITMPNYTSSKAGKKGEAHHVFGAAVVERDGELFHLRQINALKDGTFIDLATKYTPNGTERAPRALAAILGDAHVLYPDPEVLAATFDGPDSILAVLDPEKVLHHDVLHFGTRSHWTIDDEDVRYNRALGYENDSVEIEVKDAVRYVDDRTPKRAKPYVIAANHDEAFDRWLKSKAGDNDPVNAEFYHLMKYARLKHRREHGEFIPAFELSYRMFGAKRAEFVRRDGDLKIADIYCGFHGDNGIDGSRGTVAQFARLGAKTFTGHGHSPEILDGAYRVGVMNLDQTYNERGPSSWLNTHGVIYGNGKRALISIIAGRWRRVQARRKRAA